MLDLSANELADVDTGKAYYEEGNIVLKDTESAQFQDWKRELAEQERISVEDMLESCLIGGASLEDIRARLKGRKGRIAELRALIAKEKEAQFKKSLEGYRKQNAALDAQFKGPYYSAVCLVIKDENEYLVEWIDHYLALGVDHIYIYDDAIDESVESVLRPDHLERVTVIDFGAPQENVQSAAYQHCLSNYGHKTRWIGFFDSDEFLDLKDHANVNAMLKGYEEHGTLFVGITLYNANGQAWKMPGGVKERFTRQIPSDLDLSAQGVFFVQTTRASHVSAHDVTLKAGNHIVNEFGNVHDLVTGKVTSETVAMAHYLTKSHEEWIKKMQRGSSVPGHRRAYRDFFKWNPDLKHLYDENQLQVQPYGR